MGHFINIHFYTTNYWYINCKSEQINKMIRNLKKKTKKINNTSRCGWSQKLAISYYQEQ